MQDQVDALVSRGVKACLLGSAQNDVRVRERAFSGDYQIVYLTPELAVSEAGLSQISHLHKTCGVSVLAIDEAHCISEWGHDYRPDYRKIGSLRSVLPGVPVVAVTATATPRVQREILESLQMMNSSLHVFRSSFERTNLRFEVRRNDKGILEEIVKRSKELGSTIVYVLTTRQADSLTLELVEKFGVKATTYHAKLERQVKIDNHESFLKDESRIMVATLAYGMGIDKKNVRFVVHMGSPASLEAYYQQVRFLRKSTPKAQLRWVSCELLSTYITLIFCDD
jgi:ATP-dependent DNA helicase RecQ